MHLRELHASVGSQSIAGDFGSQQTSAAAAPLLTQRSGAISDGDWVDTLDVRSRCRQYLCHRPAGHLESRLPLVIVLHGRRSSGREMRWMTHFNEVADRHGFVVAYPEGHQRSWNDGRGITPAAWDRVDDVDFIGRLINRLDGQGAIDPLRVAATGLSNGGVMCHRLALELGDRIAAIASVAGLMAVGMARVKPSHAVSVMLIHGADDAYMPMGGGMSRRGWMIGLLGAGVLRTEMSAGEVLSLTATATRWRTIDGCTEEAGLDLIPASGRDATSVERTVATGGRGGTEVARWTVQRGGHTWPGGPRMLTLGRTSTLFDASEEIWKFAAAHFHPAAARRLAAASA